MFLIIIQENMEKREFVENFVREINNEIIDIDNLMNINEENVLTDIGIDSISFIRIIVFIETQYSIEVETEFLAMEKFQTIGDMANYVWSTINE